MFDCIGSFFHKLYSFQVSDKVDKKLGELQDKVTEKVDEYTGNFCDQFSKVLFASSSRLRKFCHEQAKFNSLLVALKRCSKTFYPCLDRDLYVSLLMFSVGGDSES